MASENDAVEYVYLNVGLDELDPTEDAVEYVYVNVGMPPIEASEAIEYVYLNVDNAALAPPGRLLALIPDYGREGWQFRIIGIGLGETQGARTSQPLLNDLDLPVVSWTNVAATAGDGEQYIDEETGETNIEHQDIVVTVPPDAASGLVIVQQSDGGA